MILEDSKQAQTISTQILGDHQEILVIHLQEVLVDPILAQDLHQVVVSRSSGSGSRAGKID